MEIKYFVAEAYRYKESGNWEYGLKGMYSDLSAAKQMYHSRLGSLIKNTNDFVMVILYDSYGNKIQSDFVDTHTEPALEE